MAIEDDDRPEPIPVDPYSSKAGIYDAKLDAVWKHITPFLIDNKYAAISLYSEMRTPADYSARVWIGAEAVRASMFVWSPALIPTSLLRPRPAPPATAPDYEKKS